MSASLERFLQALESSGVWFWDYLAPGLSRDELMSTVEEMAPELLPCVDDTIVSWFSWHNGVDDERAKADGIGSRSAYIAPDRPTLHSLQVLLEWRSIRVEIFRADLGIPIEVPTPHYFPFASDEFADMHALRQTGASGDWELWTQSKDEGLDDWRRPKHQLRVGPGEKPPLYREWELEDGPPIRFDAWLDALSDGLEAGRIVTANFGLTWAVRGPKLEGFHKNHDPTNAYPWK